MRLLLLGGSGFLGRHVAREAAASSEYELIVHVGRTGQRADHDSGGRSVVLDLLHAPDTALLELITGAGPDAIVNATGATSGDVGLLQALNVQLVDRLLEATAAAAPGARFVQIGSAAELGRTPAGEPIEETASASPLSDYGRSKLAGTRRVMRALESGSVRGVVLRVFNPVGAGMSDGTLPGRAAQELRSSMASNASSIRLGPLDDHRDFVDARDVASAVLLAAQRATRAPLLNVGSGEAVRARDLVEMLVEIAGFDGQITEEQPGSGRSSAVPWQQADISLIRAELGWFPRHGLRDALHALWAG